MMMMMFLCISVNVKCLNPYNIIFQSLGIDICIFILVQQTYFVTVFKQLEHVQTLRSVVTVIVSIIAKKFIVFARWHDFMSHSFQ